LADPAPRFDSSCPAHPLAGRGRCDRLRARCCLSGPCVTRYRTNDSTHWRRVRARPSSYSLGAIQPIPADLSPACRNSN
jgi:hypothetical protein